MLTMKRIAFFFLLLLVNIQLFAWTSPVSLPDIGSPRLRIVGQNAQNYLTDFTAYNSSCSNQAEFDAKTDKMANVFIALEADIVAMCEVEENDTVMRFICDAMNTLAQTDVYTFITDGLKSSQSSSGYTPTKAGYIYRKDKVTPEGKSYSPYTSLSSAYAARMRIQAFKETATGEVFTLSMNHFKAKDNSADQSESVRMENVNKLIAALKRISYDPDILVMGDLNAYPGEAPLNRLEEVGYEEQLLRFDANAYSYNYKGERGLLDHVYANEPMAEQVTGAKVYHINTSGSYTYRYSDHDAYIVGLNLGNSEGMEKVQEAPAARKILWQGNIYIEINGQVFDCMGRKVGNEQ